MLRQFDNFSTWRQDSITIQPHEVATVNFKDTTPNIFIIQNSNIAMLKIGISNIPRDDSYEFKVDYNTTEAVGRPFGSNNLYILNDSSIEVKVTVFSIQKEFDPTILKNMNVSLNGYTIESSSEISSVAKGVILPTEDKNSSEAISMLRTIAQNSGLMSLLNDIAQNTANLELNAENVTVTNEYDDTDIKNKVYSIDNRMTSLSSGLCGFVGYGPGKTLITAENLLTAINEFYEWFKEFTGSGPSLNTMEDIAQNLINIKSTIDNGEPMYGRYYKNTYYHNNAIEYSHQAFPLEVAVFEYIFNDSSKPLNILLTNDIILTLLPGEKIYNLKVDTNNKVVRFMGDEPMFRTKVTYYHNSGEAFTE